MNFLKNLTISVVVAILTFVGLYTGYSLIVEAANGAEDRIFTDSSYPYPLVRSSYHDAMNDMFNDKMEKLSEIMEKEKFYDDINFAAPLDEDACTNSNVSSYCVSMEALDLYMIYLDTLAEMKGQLAVRDEGDYLIGEAYEKVSTRNRSISIEVEEAREALEATVSAYNEYRLAYPMHIQYEEIIDSLLKYRAALDVIRKRVRKFPGKFIDATSVFCN